MKNLKKLVSVVLSLAMIISSMAFVSAKDFGDVDTNAGYSEAVAVLSDLAILEGDEKGNFNPDAQIKRSEFAAVLCRALGQEASANGSKGATQFADVAADHWATGYINWAAAAGIVNGKGNGIFDPDAPVKYEEAIKMIVVALGYEPLAARKGGYPTGYQVVASSNGITSGVAVNGSANAPRKDVAVMVYNSLDVPLMDANYYSLSGADDYIIYNGKNYTELRTILGYYLDITKVKATVAATAVSDSSLTNKNGDDKVKLTLISAYDYAWDEVFEDNYKKGSNMTIYAGDTDVADYIAQEVVAYVGVDENDDYVLLSVVGASKASQTLEVSANIEVSSVDATTKDSKVTAINGYTFEYYANANDARTEEVELDPDSRIFVNNVEITDLTKKADAFKAIADNAAKVVFMGNNSSSYDYDKVFITQYAYAVVDSVKADAEIIKLNAGSLDLSTETRGKTFTYTLTLEDGTAIALADLKKNDVLNIACASTSLADIKSAAVSINKMDIIVSRKAVEGSVSEVIKDGVTYVINDEEYDIVKNSVSIDAGDSGRYLVTVDGKVVAEDETWVSEEAAAGRNYGFVVALGSTESFGNVVYQVKMFTTDGSFVTYDVAEKLYVYDNAKADKSAALEVATEVKDGKTVAKDADGKKDDQNDYFGAKGSISTALADADETTAKDNIAKRFIAYELNSANEIKTIRVAQKDNGESKNLRYEVPASTAFRADTEKFCGKTFTAKSILISAPVKGTDKASDWNVDQDDLEIVSFSGLDEETAYADTYLFDVDADDKTIGVAVATTDDLGTNKKSALAVAYSVSTVSDGMEKVSFLQAGEYKSYVISDNVASGTVKAGDIFQYSLAGDEINKIEVIYDGTNDVTKKNAGSVTYAKFYTMAVGGKFVTSGTASKLVDGLVDYVEGTDYVFAAESEVGTVALYNAARSGKNAVKAISDLTSLYESSESYNDSAYAYKTIVRMVDGDVVDAVQYQVKVKTAFPGLK